MRALWAIISNKIATLDIAIFCRNVCYFLITILTKIFNIIFFVLKELWWSSGLMNEQWNGETPAETFPYGKQILPDQSVFSLMC